MKRCLKYGFPIRIWVSRNSRQEMMSREFFIGGFAGGFLARRLRIGYGIYFTTDRVIGVDLSKGAVGFLEGSMAGFVEGQLMPKLAPEESAKVITELDGAKEFDMAKGQTASIQIKRPGLLGGGHLQLKQVNGEKVRSAFDM